MNKNIKFSIAVTVVLITIFIIYSFLFGKLFPYSPVIIGFSANETSNAVIYIQKGAKFTDFDEIDPQFPLVEKFFEMAFSNKPRIFIFKDAESYCQRSITKARFCSFYNGDIVIAPWALEEAESGKLSLDIYLRHELSHSLIHQQSGIIKAFKFPKWLHEGSAMYAANQMGTTFYPSKEKTYQYIRQGNFLPPQLYKTNQEEQIKLNVEYRIGFIFSEFACIVDYLIAQYGREKFLLYIKTLINNTNHDKAFKNIYGLEFNKCIEAFRARVINKT